MKTTANPPLDHSDAQTTIPRRRSLGQNPHPMRLFTHLLAVTLAALMAPNPSQAQIPEGWEIVEIFPAGTEYHCSWPDINDRGQVVFHRRLWPGLSDVEIMLYDRDKLIQLTDDETQDSFPRINNRGHIVWVRDLDLEPDLRNLGIVLWRAGDLDVISDGPDLESGPDINDAGQIVWACCSSLTENYSQIFFYDGTRTVQITDDRALSQQPRINQLGSFTFSRINIPHARGWDVGAFFGGDWISLTTRTDTVWPGGLNDRQQAVWAGPSSGVVLWHGGTTQVLLGESVAGVRGINNEGDVVITRVGPVTRQTSVWLWRRGELIQITDREREAGGLGINERGEVLLEFGPSPYRGIAVFTKASFRADLDFDGDVDLHDVAVFQRCFGGYPLAYDECCSSSDANRDGSVDATDSRTITGFIDGPGEGPSDVYDYWRDVLQDQCDSGQQ